MSHEKERILMITAPPAGWVAVYATEPGETEPTLILPLAAWVVLAYELEDGVRGEEIVGAVAGDDGRLEYATPDMAPNFIELAHTDELKARAAHYAEWRAEYHARLEREGEPDTAALDPTARWFRRGTYDGALWQHWVEVDPATEKPYSHGLCGQGLPLGATWTWLDRPLFSLPRMCPACAQHFYIDRQNL